MKKTIYILLIALNLVLLLLNLAYGSVEISWASIAGILFHTEADYTEAQRIIVLESRLPEAVCAMATGSALGVCGLLLQSYFRNPLAGPSILGITSGAQLMVALVTLTGMGLGQYAIGLDLVVAALLGAFGMLLLLLWIGKMVRNSVALLIVGLLLSYLTSAILTLLNYHASAEGIQSLMLWGMGTFSNIGLDHLPLYLLLIVGGLICSALLIKPLNGWMLGELYAQNLGINIIRTRWILLLCSGLLCAVTTAWCGPISFIGLSMPHVARLISRSDDHRSLLPLSLLLGGACCSLCLLISTMPEGGRILPINAITPLLGIPVILWVIFSSNRNIR